jgi:hypothetical protein
MTDLTNAGAPANETSLRDLLASEFDKASAPETPAAPVAAVPAPAQETAAEAEARARDEKGRFAAKPEETAAKPATEAPAKPVEEKPAVEPAKEAEATTKAPVGPPPGWSIAAKADFDTLPDAVKAAVAKREEEIDRGFAKLKDYKAIETQHSAQAQQYGVPLPEFINRLAAADKFLQTQPLERHQVAGADVQDRSRANWPHSLGRANAKSARAGNQTNDAPFNRCFRKSTR